MANIKQLIETKPISNRTYNLDEGDIRTPYSFKLWQEKNKEISPQDKLTEYKKYLSSWYKLKTLQTAESAITIREQYVNTLKQVLKNYEIDYSEFLKEIDYEDITDLSIIIPHVVKSIKNEVLKIQSKRKELPKIIKTFEFVGTKNGIELQIKNHLLKTYYVKNNEYDINKTYLEYPSLSSANTKINVSVEELYDLTDNYFNSFYDNDIEDFVNLDVQNSFKLLEDLSSETLKYAQEGRYYNFDWENVYSILNNTQTDYLNQNIAYLLNDSSGNDIITSFDKYIELNFEFNSIDELPIYVFEKYDRIKDNLINVVEIFKKYSGSDIYYHKKSDTNESGKLIDSSYPHQNVLNVSSPTVANIQNYSDRDNTYDKLLTYDGKYITTNLDYFITIPNSNDAALRSIKEIGGYFIPDKLGISIIVDKGLSWEIDWDNSVDGKFYSYPNPNVFSNSLDSGYVQNNYPIIFNHSNSWMFHDKNSGRIGYIKNDNYEQSFDGYASSYEIVKSNNIGIHNQNEILFLKDGNVSSPWVSDDFQESDNSGVDFSWVIIPSTKQYSFYNTVKEISDVGSGIFKWIKNNINSHKIDLVLCTGDLVTYNYSDDEWSHIRKWFSELDGIVPYIICKGEYDYGSYRTTGYYNFNSRTSQMDNWFKPWENNKNTTIKECSISAGIVPYVNTIFDGSYNLYCSYPNTNLDENSLIVYDDSIFEVYKTTINYNDSSLSGSNVYKLLYSSELTPNILSASDICYMNDNKIALALHENIYITKLNRYTGTCPSTSTSEFNWGETVNSSNQISCMKYDPEDDVFYATINNEKFVKILPVDNFWLNGFNSILLWDNTENYVSNFEYDWKTKYLYFLSGDSLVKFDLSGNSYDSIQFGKLGNKVSLSDDGLSLYTNTNPGILQYKFYQNKEGMLIDNNIYSQQSSLSSLSAATSIRKDNNNQFFEYISPDNKNYLIFATEFYPRTSVLSAISSTLIQPEYSKYDAILLTHAYLYPPVSGLSGRYSDDYDPTQNHNYVYPSISPTLSAYTEYKTGNFNCNDGKNIYYNLINKVPNFKFTFSGHHTRVVEDVYAERIDTTQYGNQVISTSFETENPTGLIRIVQFLNGGKQVRFKTLSTITGEFQNTSIFDRTINLSA